MDGIAKWGFFERKCESCLGELPFPVFALEIEKGPLSIRTLHFFGGPPPGLEGPSLPEAFQRIIPPEEREKFEGALRKLLEEGKVCEELPLLLPEIRWGRICLRILLEDGDSALALGVLLDITLQKDLEENLRREARFWQEVSERAPVGVILYREKFVYANPYVLKSLGYTLEELREKYVWEVVHPRFREKIKERVRRRLSGKAPGPELYTEIVLLTKNGKERVVNFLAESLPWQGEVLGLGIGLDLTPQKVLERRLTEVALFDGLTGLPNRTLFLERLRALLLGARRHREEILVLVLDFRKFREINAAHGYEAGDTLLKEVARRLAHQLREEDLKARLFADKFALALRDLRGLGSVAAVIRKIQGLFERPFRLDSREIFLFPRMGGAVFPRDGEDPEEVVSKAEIALKRAKEADEPYALYSPELERLLLEEDFLKRALLEGLKKGEFFLSYQPIVTLQKKQVIGAEALVRWQHPELGPIAPAKFIPLAERTGLIEPLGDYVLSQALKEFGPLAREKGLELALNFSPRQFCKRDLSLRIEKALTEANFPPEKLFLEITESTAMEDPALTLKILEDLRSLGLKVALDDFGMGYSSLRYLVEFAVDRIKVDQFFVSALPLDSKALHVIRTILELARSVGARGLAEGIERADQVEILLKLGCEEGQGYFFGRPVRIEDFGRFL
ncbi:putative bifunctional diguanylate cyclase/phosphodiesterase [Thermosulfurimonas marina]|uniref:putative bifunctional diguanylate cyclase/phosphodiesterase n=1 Tax=Thermosulfurimonas marina TaxID=2047767 RepID=UPI00144A66FF|nr:EAL domain-containing protein [Thermosulfurimonas marina]